MDGTCRHPDRDIPKLLCGAPLPCPHHTATIDLDKDPPTIEIPCTADKALINKDRLVDVARSLRGLKP